jgi:mono/diheme cytochrome c family protein
MRKHSEQQGKKLWLAAISLASAALIAACAGPEPPATTPTPTPAATSTPAASSVTRDTINPLPDLARAAAAGQTFYQQNCAMCHGDKGGGDGPLSASLTPKPESLTSELVTQAPDGEIFLTIKNGKMREGKATMPPVRGLSDEEIWQVVAYVRSLAKN